MSRIAILHLLYMRRGIVGIMVVAVAEFSYLAPELAEAHIHHLLVDHIRRHRQLAEVDLVQLVRDTAAHQELANDQV